MNTNVTVRIAAGSEIETIDNLIEGNSKNRKLRREAVVYFREEIEKGRWKLTNQGIGVSASGVLVDGQHRLHAIREAGYPPVPFLLVQGLDEDAALFIDQGMKRSNADLLKFAFDLELASRFGSVLALAVKVHRGVWNMKVSPADLVEAYERFGDAVAFVYSVEKSTRLAAPIVCAIAMTYDETGCSDLSCFVEQVVRGEMLSPGSPALALRNFLESDRGTRGGSDIQKIRYAKAKSAAEAFIDGREIKSLRAKAI